MSRLLVSVRSAEEARIAVEGGAGIIDVKEPRNGSLGRADVAVWAEVRAVVPEGLPVSVALGELIEWTGENTPMIRPEHFEGIAFRKLGLAAAPADWVARWASLREQLGPGPGWIAVVYADWERAKSPTPDAVIDAALATDDCVGVLYDTFDKSYPSPIDLTWRHRFDHVRTSGRFNALAGKLDAHEMHHLAPLRPIILAVRGAACVGGDRMADIDPARVVALAEAAAHVSRI